MTPEEQKEFLATIDSAENYKRAAAAGWVHAHEFLLNRAMSVRERESLYVWMDLTVRAFGKKCEPGKGIFVDVQV